MASCGECKCEIASVAAEVEDVARTAEVSPEHVGYSLAVMHGVGKEIGPPGEIEPIFVVHARGRACHSDLKFSCLRCIRA
jgi:hypothetical protein